MHQRSAIVALAAGVALTAGVLGAGAGEGPTLDGFERFVHEDGSFRFSAETATRDLQHLGSWFVPAGDNAGFHHVYAQPGAIEAYRETGRFPDGTALVKEIVRDRRADYTTGMDVARATDTVQWFLMVKDRRGRFQGNPSWGNGWGWALFESGDPATNVAPDFRTACLACHVPAIESDWVYTEGYPVLRGAPQAPTRAAAR